MSNFDRLRPRSAANGSANGATSGSANAPRAVPAPRPDAEGKRALFSAEPAQPSSGPLGTLRMTCSGCHATSSLTPRQALISAVPSVHLPIVRRKFPSWMRCPACRRRQWVRVDLRG